MSWILYHNPKCSKSREALALLNSENADFKVVEYLKNPLTESELLHLIEELKGPLNAMVRVKEEDFTAAPFDLESKSEIAHELSLKPHLMERPILRGKGHAVIGRPMKNFEEVLTLHHK